MSVIASKVPKIAFYVGIAPTDPKDKKKRASFSRKVLKKVETLEEAIDDFSNMFGLDIEWGELDMADAVRAYSRDIYKLIKVDGITPDAFKQAGNFAFWIRKLKPLFELKRPRRKEKGLRRLTKRQLRDLNNFLNEIFALFAAYTIIKIGKPEGLVVTSISEWLREQILPNGQLLNDLRYRSITPYTISTYLHLIMKGTYPSDLRQT